MERFVFFIEQVAPGLYILCILGILLSLRSYYFARRELSGAQFELEKEIAQRRTVNALTTIFGLIEVSLAVLALSQIVAPTLRAQPIQASDAPNVTVIETPFVTAAPVGTPDAAPFEGVEIPEFGEELGLNRPFATPTLTPTPVGTIIPNVPPPVGCDTTDANLIIPANGMVVFEATNIVGSANTTDFAFYRFEINGPATSNVWATYSNYNEPVAEGQLGLLIPNALIPGEYQFRLVVFDTTNELRASCTITIIISPPIPTATPIR